MRIDRYTQKMQGRCKARRILPRKAEPGNWERTFCSPCDQAEGVTRPLLEKIGVSADALRSD